MVTRGVHWQLLWFALIATTHGVWYLVRWLTGHPNLPQGVAELPGWLLVTESLAWLAAGISGLLVALVVRRGHRFARAAIGIVCMGWAGAYVGGLVAAGSSSWLAASLYLYLGAAVLTPPVWQVTIRTRKET